MCIRDSDDDDDSSQAKNREKGIGNREQAGEIREQISEINPDDLALVAADLRGLREAGLGGCADCAYGSNNWVVAGSHTASGKPLLSNDMHLGLAEPNIWYMADLKAPGFHAAGVTLPGVPFVIAGHNEHVAWGFTALYADVQDLYIEKVQGDNYEGNDGQQHPLKVNHETIKVRGGADVQLEVKETDHGPLLNPILPKEKRAIALKWTLYDLSLIHISAICPRLIQIQTWAGKQG